MTSQPLDPSIAEDRWTNIGVELVLTLMASASTDKIRPIDWWTRARTALETACESADSFPGLMSRAADKLQIEVFREKSANWISSVRPLLQDAADFVPFRDFCSRNAVYIVAIAQAQRAATKESSR